MSYTERDPYGIYSSHPKDGPGPYLMGANTLVGNDVRNLKDENLGDIKEIMLNVPTGKIAYAVLSHGGFLSVGEKLFAVPWEALKLDPAKECFILDIEKSRLEDAPGFDKNHWPDMADESWKRRVHSYYGTTYDSNAERF